MDWDRVESFLEKEICVYNIPGFFKHLAMTYQKHFDADGIARAETCKIDGAAHDAQSAPRGAANNNDDASGGGGGGDSNDSNSSQVCAPF